jgi:uncharacterized membrane-anchored protein
VVAPAVVSCLALIVDDQQAFAAALDRLAERGSASSPARDAAHGVVEVAGVTLKWERHGEFYSLVLVRPLDAAQAIAHADGKLEASAFELLADWIPALPGRAIAAADIVLLQGADTPPQALLYRMFRVDALSGAAILDGAAHLYTDFVLREDGRTRWLVVEHCGSDAQTARLMQRIVEIEVYRMMALLAFPMARAAMPELRRIEQELARITAATAALNREQTADAQTSDVYAEERRLLDELTRVASEVEHSVAQTSFRFSAAQAYWEIVKARVTALREQRSGDIRTIGGFLSRRMAPAMNSCAATVRRQEALSARIERASALLRTRVDIAREEQNQQLLAAMDRRGKLSLKMQQAVEGLSVAALTYYAVGLVGYAVKPLKSVWPMLNPEWITAAAIPLLGYLVWRGVHRIREEMTGT